LKSIIRRCVDCGGSLSDKAGTLVCFDCSRIFTETASGVWKFESEKCGEALPQFYDEHEFQRWLSIFRETESKNWVIYKNSFYRYFSQAGHRLVAKALNGGPEEKIIEIGAGTGALLNFVEPANYVAVDVSLEGLECIKNKFPFADCVEVNCSRLPFTSSSVSRVVSIHSLEHLYFLAETLQEIKRILSDEGEFHFVIPTEGSFLFWLGRQLITGPRLRKDYDLDVNYVMAREHINDASRVLKFLRLYFDEVEIKFWPFPSVPLAALNTMVYGRCRVSRG
jgi:SAM-dependent methyltransferase